MITGMQFCERIARLHDAILASGPSFLDEFEEALRRSRAWWNSLLWREEAFRPIPGPEEDRWRARINRFHVVLDALDEASKLEFPNSMLHPAWPAILRAVARAARSAAASRFYNRSIAALRGAAVERPQIGDLQRIHDLALELLMEIERAREEEPRPEPGVG